MHHRVFVFFKKKISLSWKDTAILFGIMSAAVGLTIVFNAISTGAELYVPMIFLLAVFLVSFCTNGYLYGIVGSIVGVLMVNYAFTYPYYKVDFSIQGYPITFFIMLTVTLLTCTMTSNLKKQERLKIEMESEKMRANLLRAISHDLRTPLTSIIGVINTIIDNYNKIEQEQRFKLLNEAKEDAEWLIRLVENILLVTKINANDAELQVQNEVVEEIVAEAVQKFHKHFPGQKVEVKVPEDYLIVPMDGILIEEVLANLLENSIKHSKAGDKIELTVTKDDTHAIFIVRDYGKGFSEKVLDNVFDGYLLSSNQKNSDGCKNMGIGLSLCNSIITAHHGEMNAENAKDGGAIVSFSLPLRKE